MSGNKNGIKKLDLVYPDLKIRVIAVMDDMFKKHDMALKVTETLRTYERQRKIYEQGRSKPGDRVTNAKPGESWHNFGLAVDICFMGSDPYLDKHKYQELMWEQLGEVIVSHDLTWGGNFKFEDRPHIEKSYGLTLSEARDLGSLLNVWNEIGRIQDVPRRT